MSYGEPTLLPDYGRFIDLSNEVGSFTAVLFHQFFGYSILFYNVHGNVAEDLYCFTGCGQASYYIH